MYKNSSPMLATDGVFLPEFPVALEPKLDGIRMLAAVENGTVSLFTRNGKPLDHLCGIADAVSKLGVNNVVLDGELLAADFDATISLSSRKGADNSASLVFHVFDVVSLDGYSSGVCLESYADRRKRVESLTESERVKIVPMVVAESASEFEAFRTKCRADGFEGIMAKSLTGQYSNDRSDDWLKFKDFLTFDAQIVGFEEGKGRYAGTLGALIVEGEYEGRTIRTKVGSGFDDEQRNAFWAQRSQTPDYMVEVKCQEITKRGSARFPVFIRNRFDRVPELAGTKRGFLF